MDLMSLCKIVIDWRQGIKLAKVVGEHQNGSVEPSGRPFGEATYPLWRGNIQLLIDSPEE